MRHDHRALLLCRRNANRCRTAVVPNRDRRRWPTAERSRVLIDDDSEPQSPHEGPRIGKSIDLAADGDR
jgi:hypothetical protein